MEVKSRQNNFKADKTKCSKLTKQPKCSTKLTKWGKTAQNVQTDKNSQNVQNVQKTFNHSKCSKNVQPFNCSIKSKDYVNLCSLSPEELKAFHTRCLSVQFEQSRHYTMSEWAAVKRRCQSLKVQSRSNVTCSQEDHSRQSRVWWDAEYCARTVSQASYSPNSEASHSPVQEPHSKENCWS